MGRKATLYEIIRFNYPPPDSYFLGLWGRSVISGINVSSSLDLGQLQRIFEFEHSWTRVSMFDPFLEIELLSLSTFL